MLIGGNGTDKSHPAIAIASEAIRSGARGRSFNVVDMVNGLQTEHRFGKQSPSAEYLTQIRFVVLQELGYLLSPRRRSVRTRPPEP